MIRFFILVKACLCFTVLQFRYPVSFLKFNVHECPVHLDCISLLEDAYKKFHDIPVTNHLSFVFTKNKKLVPCCRNSQWNVHFHTLSKDQFEGGVGGTTFRLSSVTHVISKATVHIDPFGLHIQTLKNVLLHEMGHLFLLNHSLYTDSVMGYRVKSRYNPFEKGLHITYDDHLGLVSSYAWQTHNTYKPNTRSVISRVTRRERVDEIDLLTDVKVEFDE